jgi:hypothetical protein
VPIISILSSRITHSRTRTSRIHASSIAQYHLEYYINLLYVICILSRSLVNTTIFSCVYSEYLELLALSIPQRDSNIRLQLFYRALSTRPTNDTVSRVFPSPSVVIAASTPKQQAAYRNKHRKYQHRLVQPIRHSFSPTQRLCVAIAVLYYRLYINPLAEPLNRL